MTAQALTQNLRDGSAKTLVEFCRFARAHGLGASTKQTLGCIEVVRTARITDLQTLKFALRAVLCSSKDEWDLFDDLFSQFWQGATPRPDGNSKKPSPRQSRDRAMPDNGSKSFMLGAHRVDPGVDEAKTVAGASTYERLRKIDFSQVPHQDLADLERIAQRLLRQMSRRVSRRIKPKKSRGLVDLRRTIRLNISRGGEPIDLSHRGRDLQQPRLVILLDVSGSMNLYSLFLLRFAYALARCSRKVDAFIFSTRLVEITRLLRVVARGSAPHSSSSIVRTRINCFLDKPTL